MRFQAASLVIAGVACVILHAHASSVEAPPPGFEGNVDDKYIELQNEVMEIYMDVGDNGVHYSKPAGQCNEIRRLRQQLVGVDPCELDIELAHQYCDLDFKDECPQEEDDTQSTGLDRATRAFSVWGSKWRNITIPYEFAESASARKVQEDVRSTMLVYERFTCLRFVPWTVENGVNTGVRLGLGHTGRMYFSVGDACWSMIGGSTSGRSGLSCCAQWQFACVHEIGHNLGLAHEQVKRYVVI